MQVAAQAALVLTLMRRLRQVAEAESLALREMRLDRLQPLLDEKTALAAAYETEVAALRRSPEQLLALPGVVRDELAVATGELQVSLGRNARALTAARTVVEKVVRVIGQSLALADDPAARYGRAGGQGAERGRVVAVAFNRQI